MRNLRWCLVGLWGCWLLWLAVLPRLAWAETQPKGAPGGSAVTVLSGAAASQPQQIGAGVAYLVEAKDQPLSLDALRDPARADRWTRQTGRKINLLNQRTPVWFRLEFESRAAPPSVLMIDWPLLMDVQAHQVDAATGRLLAHEVRGASHLFGSGLNDPVAAFDLRFAESGRTTVYLRVQSQVAMIVPMAVWTREAYEEHRHTHHLVMGMLFGILSMMLLYNLVLLSFTQDRNYALYSVYLLGAVLYELALTGYGPMLFWGDSEWFTRHGYTLFAVCTFMAATLFVHYFLDIGRTGLRHMRWTTYWLVTYWVICIAAVLFWPDAVPELRIPLVGAVSGFFGIYASCRQMLRGNPSARYFTLGWSVLMVGTSAHMMALLGAVDGNWFTDYGQHVGFVIEVQLLSVALADRIKRGRLAQKQAQDEALALSLRVQQEREQKLQAQEEALVLEGRTQEALAARVRERTEALESAKHRLEAANSELATLSVTDGLTQVHNRRYFDEVLTREHERAARTGQPLALLLADIDHFKQINDRFGHLAGDECLRRVAMALRQTLGRSTDLVARYGGEEFALVLPDTGAGPACALAERVRQAVADIHFISRGQRVPLHISVGLVARVPQANEPIQAFIAEADAALYGAKGAGRNQVKLAA